MITFIRHIKTWVQFPLSCFPLVVPGKASSKNCFLASATGNLTHGQVSSSPCMGMMGMDDVTICVAPDKCFINLDWNEMKRQQYILQLLQKKTILYSF